MPLDPTLLEAVRKTLESVETNEEASLPTIARKLSLSSRTLQRHLRDMGTSLRREYDVIRCTKAKILLEDSNFSIMEVAFFLGFSEQSTFHRAFSRWTGMSPLSFRKGKMAQKVKEMTSPVNAETRSHASIGV